MEKPSTRVSVFSSGSSDRRPFSGLALALLVLLAPGAAALRPQAGSEEKVRLSSVSVRRSFHRLGPGVAGALPKKAWRAKVFGETYLFLDLNEHAPLIARGHAGT